MAIKVTIGNQEFEFNEKSKINAKGYDLEIIEPGFDEKTLDIAHGRFTSIKIILPDEIESKIKRTYLEPCSVIYKDSKGRRKLSAYFD
ncbi:MAG TPA: hypothetical protein VJ912_00360 [Candidatus Nanoarchaeia archaeon]|nr:hypothetical protein [Candidatus Nanoarchaeia archaeon]